MIHASWNTQASARKAPMRHCEGPPATKWPSQAFSIAIAASRLAVGSAATAAEKASATKDQVLPPPPKLSVVAIESARSRTSSYVRLSLAARYSSMTCARWAGPK